MFSKSSKKTDAVLPEAEDSRWRDYVGTPTAIGVYVHSSQVRRPGGDFHWVWSIESDSMVDEAVLIPKGR